MQKLKRWLPAILLCTLIFTLSSLQGASVSENHEVNFLLHKKIHLVLYFTLVLAFYRGFKNPLYSVLAAVFYGVTDETHQLFVPTREGSFFDIFVDTVGASLAGVMLWKFYPKIPHKLRNWLEE